ncbi:MAG: hypothetical protein HY075_00410 [Deltaproteobacteria bacterium]|nr:hypothetical protein [Deltaproteobacteria bacterium]
MGKILVAAVIFSASMGAPGARADSFAASFDDEALERNTQVTGSGHAMTTCQYDFFNICQSQLSRQAEDDGRRNAGFSCQSYGGKITNPYMYCQTTCNPLIAPPQPQPAPIFTTCDATCYGTCEIPD